MKRTIFAAMFLLLAGSLAQASGILVPSDKGVPALAVKYHRVDVEVRDQVAETRVEQVFTNHTNRQLEATFIFPLPEGASINDFAMMMNGKRVSGELVEKNEARKIYEDIVRKMKDPGLLEYMGCNLFKARVFPIPPNGDQKIELKYSEVLPYDSGMVRYVYPLKTGEQASQTQEDFSLACHVSSKESIKSVYSPSHDVGADRPGDHEAVIGFEKDRALLDRDFVLYYTVSEEDIGINVIPYREGDDDGYFLLLVTPGTEVAEEDTVARDMTFVVDTSGSMAEGDKIAQAKNALSQCLKSLPDRDRFNIVRFSTSVDTFQPGLVEASDENVKEALQFVDKLQARGGTQIHDALLRALSFEAEENRPHSIVFLTDGKPTVGVTDKDAILKAVREHNDATARIFVFGVGYDVNTHLLDQVSEENGGLSEYVKPEEEIEEKVSFLYNKMSKPVLADVSLNFTNIDIYDLYPQSLSDLFAGQQVTLMGRYRKSGDAAVTLEGNVNDRKREFVYETTFPDKNTDNAFIPRLWATRKVGYLLDEIRLNGETKELKDEVVLLSKEHGIMTPYTSYLVTEDKLQTAMAGQPVDAFRFSRNEPAPRRRPAPMVLERARAMPAPSTARDSMVMDERVAGAGGSVARSGPSPAVRAAETTREKGVPSDYASSYSGQGNGVGRAGAESLSLEAPTGESQNGSARWDDRQELERLRSVSYFGSRQVINEEEIREREQGAYSMLQAQSGRDAVELSEALHGLKEAKDLGKSVDEIRNVEGKTFVRVGPTWVDKEYLEVEDAKLVEIKYGSDALFALVRKDRKMAKYLALGTKVIVKFGNVFIKVGEDGKETLTDEEIEAFLKA